MEEEILQTVIDFMLPIIPSIITAIIGFIVGRADNKLNLRREIQKERFQKLYMPFVNLYDTTHMASAYNFNDFSKEIGKQYVDLMLTNVVYATPLIRDFIIRFMMLYNVIYVQEEYSEAEVESLKKVFNTITDLMYDEYNYYGNKLYYNWFDRIRNYRIKKEFTKYK